MEVDKDPPQARVEGHPLPARVESLLPLARVGSHPLPPPQSSKPDSTSRGGTPATLGDPVNPPPGRGGVGDSTWADWYQMTMHRPGGETSVSQGPPYLIGMAQARWDAVSQIYG